MAEPIYAVLVIIVCGLLAYLLRLKCLYLLFLDAFIQNIVLPFCYTSLGASRGLIASLLVSKEILLAMLFVWCLYVWKRDVQRPWPRPLVVLFVFTCYCAIRVAFALVGGDDPSQCLVKLRMSSLPLLFLTVSVTTAYTQPKFAQKFLMQMTYVLVGLAFVAILMWILPPSDFWVNHADVAAYGLDIKGGEAYGYDADTGISHTAAGRETFLSLAPFRAFGTFGDPLAMGFALTSPFLLLVFIYWKNSETVVWLAVLVLALLATFDRSAWIFVFLTCLYVLFRRRKYKWLLVLVLAPLLAVATVPELREFANFETEDLSWENPNGGAAHAEGVVWLYKSGFADPRNILGSGMGEDPDINHESGYGWLLEHFGIAAYFLWMWFLVSIFWHLKARAVDAWKLPTISSGMIIGVFVVMHFSHYPFTFIGWIPIWYLFGLSVACPQVSERRLPKSLTNPERGYGAALEQST